MKSQGLSVATAIIVAMLYAPAPSHAGTTGGDIMEAAGNMLEAIGAFILSPISDENGEVTVEPATSAQVVDLIHFTEDSPLWSDLSDAGYKLQKVVTSVGIIPKIQFEFVLARELSDADRDALERKLEIDKRKNPGLFSGLRRQIIYTLLDASDFQEMRITNLTVNFLPLPGVTFAMKPVGGGMEEDHDAIFRSVQKMRKLMERMEAE